jgi:hypothetical protein
MIVGINKAGMDRCAASVKNALRTPGIGDFLRGADGDDPATIDGDGAAFKDASLVVDGYDEAIGDDDIAAALLGIPRRRRHVPSTHLIRNAG